VADLVHKTTHVKEALARFLEQFKGKPNLEALLTALVDPIQDLEDVTIDVHTGRWLENAEGVQLDHLGDLVGQPRLGFDDDQYRLWIQARVLLNRSNGRGDELLQIADLVLPTAVTRELTEEWPAGFKIESFGYAGDYEIVFDILASGKGAGIRFSLVYSPEDVSNVFETAPAGTVVAGDTLKGFADTDQLDGGILAGVYAL
jgi:hypothetical protein